MRKREMEGKMGKRKLEGEMEGEMGRKNRKIGKREIGK